MLYFLALFCLATSPILANINQMPPTVLGFWRMIFATLALMIYFFFLNKKQNKGKLPALNKENFQWVILSSLFFFLHLWTYKYSAKHAPISNAMTLYASNPLWSTVGAMVFFQEKPKLRYGFAYLLAIVGIIFLFQSNLEFHPEHRLGQIAALSSAFLYALYLLTGKQARKTYTNQQYSFYQYGITAFCFLAVSLYNDEVVVGSYSVSSWAAVIGLVVLPTFLGHFLFSHLIKTMNISLMTCGKLIEPVISSVLAYFVFNEYLSSGVFASFIFMSTSVIILFWPHVKLYFLQLLKGTPLP